MFLRYTFVVIAALLATACASHNVDTRRDTARFIATSVGLEPFTVSGGTFQLAGFMRISETGAPASVYIEGDGLAWIDRRTISPNPTPIDPVALRLAAIDTLPNVIYLARPCQYINLNRQRSCSKAYWTNKRFASEVIESYIEALTKIKSSAEVSGFHLVGFSGGGAIAALLASERHDVISLRTIAGNLDHVTLNKSHKVSPLSGSLNPINVARQIAPLAQIHVSGSDDTVVPAWVAASFLKAAGGQTYCRNQYIVSGASHGAGWEEYWVSSGHVPPLC